MLQKFLVTIEANDGITSKEVADALNYTGGKYSLNSLHEEIFIVTARKYVKKKIVKK